MNTMPAIRWAAPATILILALTTGILMLLGKAPPGRVADIYPVDVLVILLCLDVFTALLLGTGLLDHITCKVAQSTAANPTRIIWSFGLLMFGVSAILNNLAAVFILAPIMLLVLRTVSAGPQATALTLGMSLAVCNLGGAATPIGDFPAILLMASGVVPFADYLIYAFPLFAAQAVMVIAGTAFIARHLWHGLDDPKEQAMGRFALKALEQQQRYATVTPMVSVPLCLVFCTMIVAWAVVPASAWPFHFTAIAGTVAACLIAGPERTRDVLKRYDLQTFCSMALVLAIGAVAGATGVLHLIANALATNITQPIVLLVVVMILTMIIAGLTQAGPAAAALLPVISQLANGPLREYGSALYVCFAAAICAGSSLFLWSATSGLALSGEASKLQYRWGASTYLRYGVLVATFQLVASITWAALIFVPGTGQIGLFAVVILGAGSLLGFYGARLVSHETRLAMSTDSRESLLRLSNWINIVSAIVSAISIAIAFVTFGLQR